MQILRDLDALAWLLTSSYPKIGLVRKPSQTFGILVFHHRPADRHYQRHRRMTRRGLVVGAVGSLPP